MTFKKWQHNRRKSCKKVIRKKLLKKVVEKSCWKQLDKCLPFNFYCSRQKFSACNFLRFKQLRNQHKICVLYSHTEFLKEIVKPNFEAKREQNSWKTKKAPGTSFSKKVKIVVPYCTLCYACTRQRYSWLSPPERPWRTDGPSMLWTLLAYSTKVG